MEIYGRLVWYGMVAPEIALSGTEVHYFREAVVV